VASWVFYFSVGYFKKAGGVKVINNEEIRVKLLERGASIPGYEQICIDMIVRICKNCIRIYCNIILSLTLAEYKKPVVPSKQRIYRL